MPVSRHDRNPTCIVVTVFSVTRTIAGRATGRMQRHYSTAQRAKMRDAVAKVISLATARSRRAAQKRDER
jgi:hypothetical protein